MLHDRIQPWMDCFEGEIAPSLSSFRFRHMACILHKLPRKIIQT
jgi:hypothetical protein